MSRQARVLAPAKVNLRLRVLGRRADGYHDVDTLFQAIDLADDVRVELRGAGVELDVRGADLGAATDNLAHRAARRLAESLAYGGGVAVRLEKRIPAGAGLGGGSSDAAAVLRCLSTLLDVPADEPRVLAVAAELGSDVPFFLAGNALARGTGKGEILEPLSALSPADLVLISPPVHVSTAAAYGALSASRRGTLSHGSAEAPRVPRSWDDVAAGASNDFEPVIEAAHPEVARTLDALRARRARFALLSGSGSSVFGLLPSWDEADRVAAELTAELAWSCRAVRTLSAMPAVETR